MQPGNPNRPEVKAGFPGPGEDKAAAPRPAEGEGAERGPAEGKAAEPGPEIAAEEEPEGEEENIPKAFICPISLQPIKNPVMATGSGHTYDRDSIIDPATGRIRPELRNRDPMTREPLGALVTNYALKGAIEEWEGSKEEGAEQKAAQEAAAGDQKAAPAAKPILGSFYCPITGQVFEDPVTIVQTGQTYERSALERWMLGKNYPTDPLQPGTILRKPIVLKSNLGLKSAIQDDWQIPRDQRYSAGEIAENRQTIRQWEEQERQQAAARAQADVPIQPAAPAGGPREGKRQQQFQPGDPRPGPVEAPPIPTPPPLADAKAAPIQPGGQPRAAQAIPAAGAQARPPEAKQAIPDQKAAAGAAPPFPGQDVQPREVKPASPPRQTERQRFIDSLQRPNENPIQFANRASAKALRNPNQFQTAVSDILLTAEQITPEQKNVNVITHHQKIAFLNNSRILNKTDDLPIIFRNLLTTNPEMAMAILNDPGLNTRILETLITSESLRDDEKTWILSRLEPAIKMKMAKVFCVSNDIDKMWSFFSNADPDTQAAMMNIKNKWWPVIGRNKELYKSDKGKALFQKLDPARQKALLENNNLNTEARLELFRFLVADPKSQQYANGINIVVQSANEMHVVDGRLAQLEEKARGRAGISITVPERQEYNLLLAQQNAKEKFLRDILNDNKTNYAVKKEILLHQNLSQEARGKLFMLMELNAQGTFLTQLAQEEKRQAFFASLKVEHAAEILHKLDAQGTEKAKELAKRIFAEQQAQNQAEILKKLLATKQDASDQEKALEKSRKKTAGELLSQAKLSLEQREAIFKELSDSEAVEAFKCMTDINQKIELLTKTQLDDILKRQLFATLDRDDQVEALNDNHMSDELAEDLFLGTLEKVENKSDYAASILSRLSDVNLQRAKHLFNQISGPRLQAETLASLTGENKALELFKSVGDPKQKADILDELTKFALSHPGQKDLLLARAQKLFSSLEPVEQAAVLQALQEKYLAKRAEIDAYIASQRRSNPNFQTDDHLRALEQEADSIAELMNSLFGNLKDKENKTNYTRQAEILHQITDPKLRQQLFDNLDNYGRSRILHEGYNSVLNRGYLSSDQKVALFVNLSIEEQTNVLLNLNLMEQDNPEQIRKLFNAVPVINKPKILVNLMNSGEGSALGISLFRNQNYQNKKNILSKMDADGENPDHIVKLFDAMWPKDQAALLSDPAISVNLQRNLLEHVKINPEQRERLLTNTDVINNIKDFDYKYQLIKSLDPKQAAKLFNDVSLLRNFNLKDHAGLFQRLAIENPLKASQILANCDTRGSGQTLIRELAASGDLDAVKNLLLKLSPADKKKYFNYLKDTDKQALSRIDPIGFSDQNMSGFKVHHRTRDTYGTNLAVQMAQMRQAHEIELQTVYRRPKDEEEKRHGPALVRNHS